MSDSANPQHPLGTSSPRAPPSASQPIAPSTAPPTKSMHNSTDPSRDSHRRLSPSLPPAVSNSAPYQSTSAIARPQSSTLPMPLHHRPSPPPLSIPPSLPSSRSVDMDRTSSHPMPSSQRLTYATQVMPSLPTLAGTQPHTYVSDAVAPFNRRFVAPSSRRVAIDSLLDARSHVDSMHTHQSFLPPIQSRMATVREPANMYNKTGNNLMFQNSLRLGKENRIRKVVRASNRVIPCPYENCNKTFSRNSNLKVHMRIHTRTYPFDCKLCPRKFMWSSSLHWHLKWHEKQAPQDGAGSARSCNCPCPLHGGTSPVSQVSGAERADEERARADRLGSCALQSPARSTS